MIAMTPYIRLMLLLNMSLVHKRGMLYDQRWFRNKNYVVGEDTQGAMKTWIAWLRRLLQKSPELGKVKLKSLRLNKYTLTIDFEVEGLPLNDMMSFKNTMQQFTRNLNNEHSKKFPKFAAFYGNMETYRHRRILVHGKYLRYRIAHSSGYGFSTDLVPVVDDDGTVTDLYATIRDIAILCGEIEGSYREAVAEYKRVCPELQLVCVIDRSAVGGQDITDFMKGLHVWQ